MLDAGTTYYRWASKSGFDFTNPTSFTGDTTFTDAVEASGGAVTSHSIVTIAVADTYFIDYYLTTDSWDNATTAQQQKALNWATQIIEGLNFKGDMADTWEAIRGDDTDFAQDIKDACCDIAYSLLDGIDPEKEFDAIRTAAQAIASVRMSYNDNVPPHIIAGIPSSVAYRKLIPYLRNPNYLTLTRSK